MFTNLLDDTTWFADHGYPLWIAHWNVSSPIVPANGWQGMGWIFWQWTHKPGLPGITGDLDRDRFAGTNLVTAEIARLTACVRPTLLRRHCGSTPSSFPSARHWACSSRMV